MKARHPHSAAKSLPTKKNRTRLLALEPRILFDGVALVDPVTLAAAVDHAPADTAPHPAPVEVVPPAMPPVSGETARESSTDKEAAPIDAVHDGSTEGATERAAGEGRVIVFYDATHPELADALAGYDAQVERVALDPTRDGIAQINEALAGGAPVSAIHILSHGDAGALILGSTTLSLDNLDARAADLAAWADNLDAQADILIYGCDVGAGASGETFVSRLSALTGADVAASEDVTGAAALGGDWDLERRVGTLEADILSLDGFAGLLATPDGSDQAAAVAEGGSKSFGGETFGFTDTDGDTLAAIVITALPDPADGVLTLNGEVVTEPREVSAAQFGNLVFTPANKTAGYAATFQFRVKDSSGAQSASTHTYTLNVTASDDAPQAAADSIDIDEDASSVSGNVLDNDSNDADDTLSVSALAGGTVGQPLASSYGMLSLAADGSYTYTLNYFSPEVLTLGAGETLTDTFSYTVRDAAGQTSTATLTVTINGTNDAPIASDVSVVVTTPVPENATDAENGGTQVSSLLNPSDTLTAIDYESGSLLGIAAYASSTTDGMTGEWQYQLSGSSAWVAFSPSVSAATLLPADARIRFVAADNATNDNQESGAATLHYYVWDASEGVPGETLDVSEGNRGGTHSVSQTGQSATINIAPRNDAPTLGQNTITLPERGTDGIVLTANDDPASTTDTGKHLYLYDPDNTSDQLMYRLEALPEHGKLTRNGIELGIGSLFTHEDVASGLIKYTYTGGELSGNATDSFRVSLRDGAGGVIGADGATGANAWKTITLDITDVNAQVSAGRVSFSTTEYTDSGDHVDLAGLHPADADAAGSPSGYPRMAIIGLPAEGTLQYWDGSAYVDLTADRLQGGADPLWFNEADLIAHPLRYIPPPGEPSDYGGQVQFQVFVDDGGRAGNPDVAATTATTTVTIDVLPVNDPPQAVTSPISVVRDSDDNPIGTDHLTATDDDSPVDKRVYTITDAPDQGYLTLDGVRIGIGATFTQADLEAGLLAYTHEGAEPDSDSGTYEDHFEFTVNDGDGGLSNGRLRINVEPSPELPGDGDDPRIVAEGVFRAIDADILSGSDSYKLTAPPAHGTLYLNGVELAVGASFTQADIDAGKVVYVNDGDEPSDYESDPYRDSFTIERTGGSVSGSTTCELIITPVNDAPIIEQTTSGTPAIEEHNTAGGDETADRDENGVPSLNNVSNAVKITTDNLNGKDVDSDDAQLYYVVADTPDGGALKLWNGTAWVTLNAGDRFNVTAVAEGKLAYFHDPGSELRNDSIQVYLIDGAVVQTGDVDIDGGNVTERDTKTVDDGDTQLALNIGAPARSPLRTVNFTISNVNDAPVASGGTIAVDEGTGETDSTPPTNPGSWKVLKPADLSVSDSDTDDDVEHFNNGAGEGYYELIAAPENGAVQISHDGGVTWTDMEAGTRFSHADLKAGHIRYAHDGSETTSDSFQYRAVDPHGATSDTATVNVQVRPVNDAPQIVGTLTIDGANSVPEGGARKITAEMLGIDLSSTDPDNSSNQVQYRIDAVSNLRGSLYLGDPATGKVSKTLGVGSAVTLQQILDGKLWYQHDGTDPIAYGSSASFDFTVSDSSGMGEPSGTFTIAITPINDAPIVNDLTGGGVFIEGDTGGDPNVSPIFIDNSLSLFDPDLANNNVDFRGGYLLVDYASGGSIYDQLDVANIGSGAGQIGVSGTDITYGGVVIGTVDAVQNGQDGHALRINFTDDGANPALTRAAVEALMEALTFSHTQYDNAVTGTRTLNYTLVDGGGQADYTDDRERAFDGHDTWSGTATVEVIAANDRPVLTPNTGGGNIDLGTIGEDVSSLTGVQVGSFIGGGADGAHSGIADVDTGAVQGIAIIGLTNASGGKWQYSADGTTWTNVGSVSATNGLLLKSTDYVRFVPDAVDGGTATFTYKAWDQTSGTAHGRVDTTATAQTSAFSTDTDTAQITVTPANDAPTLDGPTSVTATEDTLFSFTGDDALSLADVDSGDNLIKLTLTFTGSGSFRFSSPTSNVYSDAAGTALQSTWSGFTDGQTLTLYGTAAELNTVLGKLQYDPAADANNANLGTQPEVRIDVDDLGWGVSGAEDGAGLTATKTVTIAITPVNDAPELTLGGTEFELNENDAATSIDIDITLTDPSDRDNSGYGDADLPTLVLTSKHGNLSFGSATGVEVVSGDNSRTLTLRGSLEALTAALSAGNHQVSYQPDVEFSGTDTITLVLHDKGNVGGGDLTDTATIDVTITGTNDAPSFSGLDATPVFTENGNPIVLDGNAVLDDPELANYGNWNHAVLTLHRSGGANSDDVFGVTGSGSSGVNFNGGNIRVGGTTVGTFTNTGGTLTITFNDKATNARVNQVLQAITYSNSNDNPPGNVTIAYTINDGDTDPDHAGNGQGSGGARSGTGHIVVSITATNDAPTLSGIDTGSYTENTAPIVLADGATPIDPELSYLNQWGNATLTISRNGGANASDVFGASGTLDALVEGQDLIDNGTVLGTVTTNSGGVLKLTFKDGVTTDQVRDAIRQITYANTRESLAAGETESVTLDWTLSDGDTDPDRENNGQGVEGAKSDTVQQTVTVTGINDAPVLGDTTLTVTQTEDADAPTGAVGTPVSALTGGVTDADTTDPQGVAIVAADSTLGTWYYSTDNGAHWTVMPAVAADNALLLRANDLVYFQPTGDVNGAIAAGLTVRAWDQSDIGTHAQGTRADTTTNGDDTPYSSATDTVQLTVTAVNDAPTRTENSVTITVGEDSDPAGHTVSDLFSPVFSDAADDQTDFTSGSSANPLAGVAIVGNAASAEQGTWQYNSGDGWVNLPTVALDNAFLLKATDSLRFVPAADFHGTPGALTVRLADSSGTAITSGTRADISGSATGGTTRYSDSANAVELKVTVNAANDAPTLDGTSELETDEDTTSAGRSAADIAADLTYGDATDDRTGISGGGDTSGDQTALAIVGNAATSSQGTWQYTLDGTHWSAVPTDVGDGAAIVLSLSNPNHQVRFVPVANFNGTPGGLTVRAADDNWDGETGVIDISADIGETHAWSSDTASVDVKVAPVNDKPSIDGLDESPTFTEGKDTADDRAVLGTPVVLDSSVTIADIELVTQHVDDFGGATLRIARDDGDDGFSANGQDVFGLNTDVVELADNVISIDGVAVADITSNAGGELVITFRSAATSANVNTVAGAITYANASDTPPETVDLRYRFSDDNQADAQGSGGPLTGDATISVTIVAVNDPPIAVNDTATVTEDGAAATGSVLTGTGADSDPEGDTLTVTGVRTGTETGTGTAGTVGEALTGTYGSLTLNDDGTYTYTLDNGNADVNQLKDGETLTEVYTYTISDGNGGTDTAQLKITINGKTDGAPVISATDGNDTATGQATVDEAGLTDGDDTSETTTGSLSITAADGLASIKIGDTTVTLAELKALSKDEPVVIDTGEGTLKLTGFAATNSIGGVPTAGTVNYSYTLKAALDHTDATESTDSIALIVTDVGGETGSGTLTVGIIDDTPTATADTATIVEDATSNTVSGNLTTNDRIGADTKTNPVTGVVFDGDDQTVGTAFDTAYGSIVVNANGSYTYTLDNSNSAVNALSPDSDPLTDTISYTITDGDGDTSTATLTITITGSNDAPVLNDTVRGVTQIEDAPTPEGEVGVLVSDLIGTGGSSDPDADAQSAGIALTGADTSKGSWFYSLDGGENWTAVGAVGNDAALLLGPDARLYFAPSADRNTSDGPTGASAPIAAGLSFRAWDRSAGTAGDTVDASTNGGHTPYSATADTVQLTITPVNDGPSIDLDAISPNANASHPYIPGAGGVVIDPEVTFGDRELGTERDNWNGATLTVSRNGGASTDDQFGATGSLSLADGEIVVDEITIGSYTNTGGTLTLTFNANATTELVNTAARNLTYSNAQANPSYSSVTLSWTLNDQNSNASGSGSAGSGTDQGNGGALSTTAKIVLSLNQPPTAVADTAIAVERGGVDNDVAGTNPSGNVLDNDTDPDPVDTKTVTTTGTFTGTYGTLTLNADGSYSYVLNNDHPAVEALRTPSDTLSESFDYTMRDAAGLTSASTLKITIQGANDTPVAVNDTAEAIEAGGLNNATPGLNPGGNVLANDTDIDAGDSKTVVSTGDIIGSYGTLTLHADGNYSYAVDNDNPLVQALRTSGDTLTDVVTYTMRDAAGATSTATLTITIRGANDTPVAANDTAIAVEAGGIENQTAGTDPSGNVLDNDSDVDGGDSKTVTSTGEFVGSYGTLTLNADGSYTYRVDNNNLTVERLRPGETLTESFGYTMRDTAGATSSATLTLTISGSDDALLPPPPPSPPPAPPVEPPPSVVPPPTGQPPVDSGGSSGGSSGGLAFFNAAQDAYQDGHPRLELRTTTEASSSAAGQNGANESRKLESTDRGFPVERIQGQSDPGALVSDQQKGGDKLFVYKGINNTFGEIGVGLDYHVPREAFGHTDPNAIVQLEAGLADGNPLPEWMDFDPTSGTFSGRPPADAGDAVEVKVIARDNEGREASTTFRIEIRHDDAQHGKGDAAEPQQNAKAKPGKNGKDGAALGAVPFSEQIRQARHGDGLLDTILAIVEAATAPTAPAASDNSNVKETSA